MGYKLKAQDENPLWRNYMDNVNGNEEWMKVVKLDTPFPLKSYGTYNEEEFEQMLIDDIQFNEMWGVIKHS